MLDAARQQAHALQHALQHPPAGSKTAGAPPPRRLTCSSSSPKGLPAAASPVGAASVPAIHVPTGRYQERDRPPAAAARRLARWNSTSLKRERIAAEPFSSAASTPGCSSCVGAACSGAGGRAASGYMHGACCLGAPTPLLPPLLRRARQTARLVCGGRGRDRIACGSSTRLVVACESKEPLHNSAPAPNTAGAVHDCCLRCCRLLHGRCPAPHAPHC